MSGKVCLRGFGGIKQASPEKMELYNEEEAGEETVQIQGLQNAASGLYSVPVAWPRRGIIPGRKA